MQRQDHIRGLLRGVEFWLNNNLDAPKSIIRAAERARRSYLQMLLKVQLKEFIDGPRKL